MKNFSNSFHKIEQDTDRLISLLVDQDSNKEFIKVLKRELSFLPLYSLVELLDAKNLPPLSIKAIVSDDLAEAYSQGGSQEQFCALADLNGFSLTQDTILDYVRCFFYCVYGLQGKLVLIENVDDIEWRDAPAPSLLSMVIEEVKPLYVSEIDGQYIVEGHFISNNALVKANIIVVAEGKISVEGLSIIFENLPVKSSFIDF